MAKTISELARDGGVGVETVRYYQRRGLLFDPRPGTRRETGRRHYSDEHAARLRFIRSAQRAGFTLEEIGGLIAPNTSRGEARALARSRIAKLDEQITEMQAARAWLGELARECAASPDEPCPIIAAFEA